MIITNLYPHQYNSSAGIFVYHQAIELAKHYEVMVVATCDGYPYSTEFSNTGNLRESKIYYPYWKRYYLSSLFTYRLFAIPFIKQCLAVWQPELIHVHDFRHVPELVCLKPWLNKQNLPQYLTVHNIRTHPLRLVGNHLRWFYKQGMTLAFKRWTHIFTVNSRLAEWVLPYTTGDKLSVIGNAISPFVASSSKDLSKFTSNLSPTSYKIISVGNLVTEKGFHYLIEAVHILCGQGFEFQLSIVGDGPQRDSLIRQIAMLKLETRVTLCGRLDNSLVRSMYAHFDVFVLPSYSETFGIVYIEAMFAGLPVIGVTGQGIYGIMEDGKEAMFAKAESSSDLADKIKFLIENPDVAKSIADAGCTLVTQTYLLPKLIAKITDVYERQ
jgi:glycosyltransferase involved in cell wall biosynthesis